MQQRPRVPGADFYLERLARAQALPEVQCSADVWQWLRLHARLDAAAAALPALPISCQESRPLREPLGGDQALAGLLRLMAAAFAEAPCDPLHPKCTLRLLTPQLPPLMRVWAAGPSQVRMAPEPELQEILMRRGSLDPNDADLETLTRLLLLAMVAAFPELEQHGVALRILAAIQPPLFSSAASLDRQLERLQQRCGNSSGTSGGDSAGSSGSGSSSGATANSSGGGEGAGVLGILPPAAQLQAVWAVLSIELAMPAGSRGAMPQTLVASTIQQAARTLLRLQPTNPRSHFWMGQAAVVNASTGSASALRDPLPHFQRGAELVRQQGSDFWLARCGWLAALVAASDCNQAVSPAAAAALMQEADAAYTANKSCVPPQWLTVLKGERESSSPIRSIIEGHVGRSPSRWQAAIRQQRLGEQQRRIDRVLARADNRPSCDACGLPSAGLKRCSACGKAKYCSRACQRNAWPAHKAECRAAAAAACSGSA